MAHPIFSDVVIMQTCAEELRHRSLPVYTKMKNLMEDKDRHFYQFANEHHRDTYIERLKDESPNDRNDRAIRHATKWYLEHLKVLGRAALLVTDDVDCRRKAREQDGIMAVSGEYTNRFNYHLLFPSTLFHVMQY